VHVLSAIARSHALILVIDDLQWADSGSVGLLFHLGKRLEGQRILLVGAYRPEEIAIGRNGARHPLEKIINEFKRDFGKMQVDLDRSEGRAFVDALIDSEPNCLSMKFRGTFYQHTSGHPLFTVELLRGLQERGDLIKSAAGQWTESRSLDWEKLPPRVEAVIAERIGRLPDAMQSLLNAASVEGEEFTAEILAQVCSANEADVIQELSGALSKQHRLVRAQGTGHISGHRIARYRFAHFLFQKYLYQRLDEIERPRLHEAAGDALEKLVGDKTDEYAVQLARHFEIAGVNEKAIDYLWLAGERAVRLLSNEEAVTLYRHGLGLLQSLPDSPEKMERELKLQVSIGVPLLALRGGFSDPELARAYGRAREICQQIGSAPELFHALRGLKGYYDLRGEIYTARDLGRQMLTIAEQQGDEDLLIMAHNNLATTLLYAGDLTAYNHHLKKVIELYDFDRHRLLSFKFGYDPKVATMAHAMGLWMLGYPDEALRKSRAAVQLADEIGQPFSQCFAYYFASHVHLLRREAQATLEAADKAISFSQQHRIPFWMATGLTTKGWAIARMGRREEGLTLLIQGNDILRAVGSTLPFFGTAAWYSEVCALAGKVEEGLARLDEVIPQSIQAGEVFVVPNQYQCRGELLLKLGRTDEAEASFEKAIDLARQQQAKSWELRAVLSLARLWITQGKAEAAYHRLRDVYDWFTEGFDTPDLVDAKALLDELYSYLSGGVLD
jgi:predicted ATPase